LNTTLPMVGTLFQKLLNNCMPVSSTIGSTPATQNLAVGHNARTNVKLIMQNSYFRDLWQRMLNLDRFPDPCSSSASFPTNNAIGL
jgi:hypothetical protein